MNLRQTETHTSWGNKMFHNQNSNMDPTGKQSKSIFHTGAEKIRKGYSRRTVVKQQGQHLLWASKFGMVIWWQLSSQRQRRLSWNSCQEEMIVFPLPAEETLGGNEFPTKHNLNQTISQGKCRTKFQLNSSIGADWLCCTVWYKLHLQELGKYSVSNIGETDNPLLWGDWNPHTFTVPLPR